MRRSRLWMLDPGFWTFFSNIAMLVTEALGPVNMRMSGHLLRRATSFRFQVTTWEWIQNADPDGAVLLFSDKPLQQ